MFFDTSPTVKIFLGRKFFNRKSPNTFQQFRQSAGSDSDNLVLFVATSDLDVLKSGAKRVRPPRNRPIFD
jgi:hypothetical protein